MRERRRRPAQRIGELLPGLAAKLGLEKELKAARAVASWGRVVAERVPVAAGTSRLVEIRPPALIVSADDAATAQELRLRAPELLDAFAIAPGGVRLLELKVIVRTPTRRS
jgi:predicted nucleic acid-binding Zn ribbon protein